MREFLWKNAPGLLLISSVAFIVLLLIHTWYIPEWELKAYDLRSYFRLKPASSDIVIVKIDKESLISLNNDLGRWPWPRTSYAKVINSIHNAGAAAIFLDIKLESPATLYNKDPQRSDTSFYNMIKNVSNIYFAQEISQPYMQFVKSLESQYPIYVKVETDKKNSNKNQINRILSLKEFIDFNTYRIRPSDSGILKLLGLKEYNKQLINKIKNKHNINNNILYSSLRPYIPAIYSSGRGISIVNVEYDNDNTVRRIKPVFIYRNLHFFHASVALAKNVLSDKQPLVIDDVSIKINNKVIALDEKSSFYLNWRTPFVNSASNNLLEKFTTFKFPHPSISFMNVYNEQNNPVILEKFFKNKIVIIGATASEIGDYVKTPYFQYYPGPEIVATAVDNLINDTSFIQKAPLYFNALVSILLVASILLIFSHFGRKKTYISAGIYGFVTLSLFIALNIFSFQVLSYWFDLIGPLFDGVVAMVFAIAFGLLLEKEKRSAVENTFAKYVSPQIYKTLMHNYEKVNLGADKREVTILFSDIRGFTPFIENLQPEEAAKYLNEYFTEMVKVILKNNGTIDKFMGDAIMAFFGAPLIDEKHSENAVKAAVEMLEALEKLNKKWAEEGRRSLNIGIGINTGVVLLGNFGSPELMDYTVMGDPVNLASRLESLNKEENTNVIISEYTYQKVKGVVIVRELGDRLVKGKTESVKVYELLGVDKAD